MLTLSVNGRSHQVEADGATPLLYVLRNDLGLNGAKFGCGLGQCGACTVLMDDKPVLSCITPITVAEGRRITTLEGLGTLDNPGPVQRAFIAEQAAQCGYCTSGMIVAARALLQLNPRPTEAQADHQHAAGGEKRAAGQHGQRAACALAARITARITRAWLPQRQRLPAIASRTCGSVGRGMRESRARAVMIMPAVQ